MDETIVFFIMTNKGYFVLNQYLKDFNAKNIEFVVIGKDNHLTKDYSFEIEELCKLNHILYYYNKDKFYIKSSYSIAISWRWMIRSQNKLIVLHDSLLPKYRGFGPLVNALIIGEETIGVTALFANEEYDRGNIISQSSVNIDYPMKISEAIATINPLYYHVLKDILVNIFNHHDIISVPQNEELASYSLWRDEDDYMINWNDDSTHIKRFIDAVGNPYSGASGILDNYKVRINNAEIFEDVPIETRCPGKVIFIKNGEPIVVCGKGLLRITDITDDQTKKNLIPFTKIRVRFK